MFLRARLRVGEECYRLGDRGGFALTQAQCERNLSLAAQARDEVLRQIVHRAAAVGFLQTRE